MHFSGIQKLTLLDYPGKTSCILFTPGCNFRCGFCHNPEFVLPKHLEKLKSNFIQEESVFRFLEKRKGLLDGVVICGGEPTIFPDLIPFMEKIKKMDFLVKLDTNGNRPEVIHKALHKKCIDYIAMDVKTSLDGYKDIVGKDIKTQDILKSIQLIKESNIDYEFRTTFIKEIHTIPTLKKIKILLKNAKRFCLQKFNPKHTLHPSFSKFNSYNEKELQEIGTLFQDSVSEIIYR